MPTQPTQQQIDAAKQAAQFDIDSGGTSFWVEIGTDVSGDSPLLSGSYPPPPPPPTPPPPSLIDDNTVAPVASVTKSLSACYAASVKPAPGLGSVDWPYLTMTSPYCSMQGKHCDQDPAETISACCAIKVDPNDPSDTCCSVNQSHSGNDFWYDSGHWQKYFNNVLGKGFLTIPLLGTAYRSLFNLNGPDDPSRFYWTSPMPAGGVKTSAAVLRSIVQQIMNGTLDITGYLTDGNLPVAAYSNGPGVHYTPAPPGKWFYKWGFWVEPDTFDFWMVGSYGTAVWIQKDFKMYGMVFRNNNGNADGPLSMSTMQNIRRAYLTGVGPLDAIANSSIGPVSSPSKAVDPVIIVLTSGNSSPWTVPDNCTSATIECIGGGQSGRIAKLGQNTNGGAGGAYVKSASMALIAGSQINYQVGLGGLTSTADYNNGQNTWFANQTTLLAPGGGANASAQGAAVFKAGGAGGGSGLTVGGGGGAGGPYAAGTAGQSPNGGIGDGTSPPGGASGASGAAGGNGTEWVVGAATVGAGGGGGGSTGGNGGAGGLYGGGGGGARTGNTAGAGANGMIVITYYAPA